MQRLMGVHLTGENDRFVWSLLQNGIFTVKSMYTDYMHGHTLFLRKYLWKLKVPLNIKVSMWFLQRKVILTKDNLVKRNWAGCKK